jgi:hypothetical protein
MSCVCDNSLPVDDIYLLLSPRTILIDSLLHKIGDRAIKDLKDPGCLVAFPYSPLLQLTYDDKNGK